MFYIERLIKCVDVHLETKEDNGGSGYATWILCENGHSEPQDAVPVLASVHR